MDFHEPMDVHALIDLRTRIRRLSLHVEDPQIDLPVNAPERHPHLIDISVVQEDTVGAFGNPNGLTLVDTLATILYKWKLAALYALLDLDEYGFYWVYRNGSDYEYYVEKMDRSVSVRHSSCLSK
jgi:hypothetical protein